MLKNMKAIYCSYISEENIIRAKDLYYEDSVDIRIDSSNSCLSFASIVEKYFNENGIKITHFADTCKDGEHGNDFIVMADFTQGYEQKDNNTKEKITPCTCKQDIENKLFKEISEKEPSKHLLSASLQGYSIIFEKDENGITCGKLRPTNTV